jgi:hypothetical protein
VQDFTHLRCIEVLSACGIISLPNVGTWWLFGYSFLGLSLYGRIRVIQALYTVMHVFQSNELRILLGIISILILLLSSHRSLSRTLKLNSTVGDYSVIIV